ncbi:FCPF [Symbiodinium sp. CCMP2456]|nr:FCPF [Symbiodinium sp. CCMP2456]
MASKKCTVGTAVGLASVVAGSAFIAGTSQPKGALRATSQAQQQARPAPSSAPISAASAVAISAGAVYAANSSRKVAAKAQVTALRAFESELGVQAPVGFWDPLGLARDGDVEAFQRRRSVELKHGRIAMLATMGYITPEIAGKWPGYLDPSSGLKFTDVPNGLAAISKVPAGGWTQILLWMAWCEVSRGAGSDIASGRPGDFGWYVLTSADPEEKKKKLNAGHIPTFCSIGHSIHYIPGTGYNGELQVRIEKNCFENSSSTCPLLQELANGRLAMMAIIGTLLRPSVSLVRCSATLAASQWTKTDHKCCHTAPVTEECDPQGAIRERGIHRQLAWLQDAILVDWLLQENFP